jgi:hypothetical protein
MLEHSTKTDDSILCQRSRIFHSKFVEHANILLIPCHLTSAQILTLKLLLQGLPWLLVAVPFDDDYVGY